VAVRLFTDTSGGNNAISVSCNAGERATGGGGDSTGIGDLELSVPLTGGSISTAGQTPNGWRVQYNGNFAFDDVTAYVLCAP
jgi:hypothetical protein